MIIAASIFQYIVSLKRKVLQFCMLLEYICFLVCKNIAPVHDRRKRGFWLEKLVCAKVQRPPKIANFAIADIAHTLQLFDICNFQ